MGVVYMGSSAPFEAPGQVAGLVMIGAETSYTSSRYFFNMEKTFARQDHPIARLKQRNRKAIGPAKRVMCVNDARGDGMSQGCKSAHVNSFSMVYRRIAGYFE